MEGANAQLAQRSPRHNGSKEDHSRQQAQQYVVHDCSEQFKKPKRPVQLQSQWKRVGRKPRN